MKKIFFILIFISIIISCDKNVNSTNKELKKNQTDLELLEKYQDSIIEKYLKNGAYKYPLYSQKWQKEIDKGLQKDSTIAYLWQQKAMPLFKQGKYEIGMKFVDKAVKYNPERWQDYRAFIKCIFAKTYKDAIIDFQDCIAKYGNNVVMDHSYKFYIGLSYLQLNEFKKAEKIFKEDYDSVIKEYGEDWIHNLDLFYFGISKYEQGKFKEAIELFNHSLEKYPEFSDVQVYKAYCLRAIGEIEKAKELFKLAKKNSSDGYTINEDNAIYEKYPYQVRW